MRISRLLPVVLCSTVVLAGCGSSSLLDGNSAEDLQASIERVKMAVEDGRCEQAMTAATEGLRRVDDLPSSVDDGLESRLRQGFQELEQRIPSDCTPRETTTTQPPPTTTTETTTEEEPPPVTTTETQPPETTPTEPTEPTQPPETTTEEEVPLGDEGSGGVPPAGDADTDELDPATPRGLREGMRELRESGRDAQKRFQEAGREARKSAREARKQFDDAVKDMSKALRGDR